MTQSTHHKYYQALIEKNPQYDGVFYVGVRTTGVFCHPTCPARKPKSENCIFYDTVHDALYAGFRPCKRCRPLSHPNRVSEIVQTLVEAVEAQPEKRWRNEDIKQFHIDPSTARRQFKKRFGITFIEYARARRLGLAMKQIKDGTSVIDAQVSAGYESGSGFRDAFDRILGKAPSVSHHHQTLQTAWIDTQLGTMVAIASHDALHLLEFIDRPELEREITKLQSQTNSAIIPGHTDPIHQIEAELNLYFAGKLHDFKTPIIVQGTAFQQLVWDALQKIPFGETRSYLDVAKMIGKPTALRAVAQANGANQLALLIPCHRVIKADGQLAGYGGGVSRKKWLINHEKSGV